MSGRLSDEEIQQSVSVPDVATKVFSTECLAWYVLLAQWITWLTRDRCNPKVPSSIPAGGKDFP